MTKEQEARFRDLWAVLRRAREGGAFAESEAAYYVADRWTSAERDVVRDVWQIAESILGGEAPSDRSWRAALTILAMLGDGHPTDVEREGKYVQPWHGAAGGYFEESVVLGELPKDAKDLYKRVDSHLSWAPKDPKQRTIEARRRAAAMRKALGLKARHV